MVDRASTMDGMTGEDEAVAARTAFRETTTPDERAAELVAHIDPGFVNRRLVQMMIGPDGMKAVDRMAATLPSSLPPHEVELRLDHNYTEVALVACRAVNARTLEAVVRDEDPKLNEVVCSTNIFEPALEVWEHKRIQVRWRPPVELTREVVLDLSVEHVHSATLKSELGQGGHAISLIAILRRIDGSRLTFAPAIMGHPWLLQPRTGPVDFDCMWLHYDFYGHFVEDIDEFAKAREVPQQVDWTSTMAKVRESAFKQCVAEVLGDAVAKDWGGERSDHFTSRVHLRGRRLNAAFLFKGPGKGFGPMHMTHLGKRGDQLYRLQSEPADLFVLQHCHDITPPVLAHLRSLIVQPSNPRRYCVIDGRDSFRLLQAYGLVQRALDLSC
jgi:hypothetical protein